MPELWLPQDGATRKQKEIWLPNSGVNRKQKELWAGSDGVNRKIFSGGVGYSISKSDNYYARDKYTEKIHGITFQADGSGSFAANIHYLDGRINMEEHQGRIWWKIMFATPIVVTTGQSLINVINATYDGQKYYNPLQLTVSTDLGIAFNRMWYTEYDRDANNRKYLEDCKNVFVTANRTGKINYILMQYDVFVKAGRGQWGSFGINWPAGGVTVLGRPLISYPTGQLEIQV